MTGVQTCALPISGDDAYKALRAIRLPFLDFSTLDKRRAACEAEIAANRDNAQRALVLHAQDSRVT